MGITKTYEIPDFLAIGDTLADVGWWLEETGAQEQADKLFAAWCRLMNIPPMEPAVQL